MTNALNLETLMGVIPSAWMTAPFAMRARINEVASFSVIETAGSALPPRSRTLVTTLQLTVRFRQRTVTAIFDGAVTAPRLVPIFRR
jgi:hypothetical protein